MNTNESHILHALSFLCGGNFHETIPEFCWIFIIFWADFQQSKPLSLNVSDNFDNNVEWARSFEEELSIVGVFVHIGNDESEIEF